MLEGLIEKFTKIETEPVGFGMPGVMILGSSYYDSLLKGKFHAVYFGNTHSGTHKDGLAEIMLTYAEKKGYNYVAVISSGSYNISLHDKILRNHQGMQLFELVDYSKLKNGNNKRGYSIDRIVGGKEPYLRIKIGAPLYEKILSKNEIEKTVAKRIKKNKELQKALNLDLGWFQSLPVLDITNPHDTIHTDEPFYNYDPNFLASYNKIFIQGGTLTHAHSVAYWINTLPKEKRPELITVVSENSPLFNPSVETIGKKPKRTRFSKLDTPCFGRAASLFFKNFDVDKDAIYVPQEKYIRHSCEDVRNMSQKGIRNHRFHFVDYKSIYQKKPFSRREHNGFETERKGIKYIHLEPSGLAPLTALNPQFRASAEKGGHDGLLVPNIHYVDYKSYQKDSSIKLWQSDLLINSGERVLCILTGQSKGIGYIEDLAKKTYKRKK